MDLHASKERKKKHKTFDDKNNELDVIVNELTKSCTCFWNTFKACSDSLHMSRLQDCVFCEVSEGFTSLTGYTKEDVVGKSLLDYIICHSDSEQREFLEKLLQKGKIEQIKTRFRRKDGTTHPGIVSAKIIEWGNESYILSMAEPVGVADVALCRSAITEQQWNHPLHYTGNAFWDWDLKHNELYCNSFWYSLLEYSPGELQASYDTWKGLIHPDDRQNTVTKINEYISHAVKEFTLEFRMKTKSDRWKWILCRGHIAAHDPLGNPIRVVGTCVDITERKIAEEALFESEQRYRSLVENAQELIMVINRSGVILFCNSKAAEYLQQAPDTVAGKSVETFIPKKIAQKHIHAIEDVLQKGKVKSCDVHLKIRNKKYFFSGNIQPIVSHCSQKETILCVMSDMTEKKKSEEEKQALEMQLLQSQKLEAVGHLVGGVAHDFNNLLTAMIGFSDIVLEQLEKDDAVSVYIRQIRKAGIRAAALTRQLLAFKQKQVYLPKILDLNKMIASLDKMLRRLLGEGIDIIKDLDSSLGMVKIDPSQFEQVLLNLAINAKDAMEYKGVLTIKTKNVYLSSQDCQYRDMEPGDYILVEITDTGRGITSDIKDKVFEPFFTTKPHGLGSGLGLSTVASIVHQSGGHIAFTSTCDEGTTFTVYLPRVIDVERYHTDEQTLMDIRGGSETILVVEDETMLRNLVEEILKRQGYNVLKARNGDQAVKLCKQSKSVDLLITDVIMPGINGKELSKMLCTEFPALKVLFISGYSHEPLVQEDVLGSGLSFLPKPFTAQALAKKIREILG